MKLPRSVRLCLPPMATALAVGLCFLLLPTRHGLAFLVFGNGEELALSQRDFRIYNNFTDAAANDNTEGHPEFPGPPEYRGAVLAIWKACLEWGSMPHGTGSGDPTQPDGVIGSGGANFDPSFQGLATSVGPPNSNIHSEIEGSNVGVVAFAETPIADGWRIRYYRFGFIFHDGPGQTPPCDGCRDLQGVAAHEYGHALGLDHSDIVGATMFPSGTNLNPLRSLHPDDIAGVQFIYGVKSPTKPVVESYDVSGSNLVVVGKNFSASDNEVWFTRAPAFAASGNGDPVKATGLASTDNGTRIALTIPMEAGPGDLLVKTACDDHACLSNAFPFDPTQSPCIPTVYGTGTATTSGSTPFLTVSGVPAPGGNLRLQLNAGPFSAPAVLFFGRGPAQVPFLGGDLLVGPPVIRERSFTTIFGSADLPIRVEPFMAGQVRNYQVWFQDPGLPAGAGLSNAVQVRFCP